jgi:PAS domain S-box-containing protein
MHRRFRIYQNVLWTISSLVGILIFAAPIGYFFVSYQYVAGRLEMDAEINARMISQIISRNPDLWEFENIRLEELLSRGTDIGIGEERRIFNSANEVIAATKAAAVPPLLRRSFPLMDSGLKVGGIEISYSLRPLINRSLMMFLLSAAFGSVILITMRVLPYRAVRKAEESLRASEKRYRRLFESANDIILGVDDKGTILYANRAFGQKMGYSPDGFCGISLQDIIQPQDRSRFADFFSRRGPGENVFNVETRLLTTGGREIDVEGDIIYGFGDDRGPVATCIFHDISYRKRTEEELISATIAARDANRLKSEFLANMSHEIRTPISGILGMTDLVLDTEITGEQRSYLKTIRKSSYSLLGIIDDILDFSKIEEGRLSIEVADFDLRVLIEEVTGILGQAASRKGLLLSHSIGGDVPLKLMGDTLRLRQVLLNLVNNAIKFTEKGTVLIEVVRNEETDRDVSLTFSVADTGIGIPEDKIGLIFEKFVQADSSVSRMHGGSGLGLAISKKLVEMMGGRIGVESGLCRGSTFRITMTFGKQRVEGPAPAHKEKTGTREYPVTPPAIMKTVRDIMVLLVEDNKVNQKIVSKFLSKAGFSVDVVDNGLLALEATEKNFYDLILMDLQMPLLDGLETTRMIREKESAGRRPVIIALTAHAFSEDRERCLSSGMDDYLPKPFDEEKLLNVIGKWFLTYAGADTNEKAPGSNPPHLYATCSDNSPVDMNCAMKKFSNDIEFFREMLSEFLDHASQHIMTIEESVKAGDAERVRKSAHTIKATAGMLGANELYTLLRRIESLPDEAITHSLVENLKDQISGLKSFSRNF